MVKMMLFMLAIGAVLGAAFMAASGPNEVEFEAQEYCQLVAKGAWPDYAHSFARQCHKDGSVNWDYVHGK